MELSSVETQARNIITNLKQQAKKPTISIKKFREAVDTIESNQERTIIETYYLCAARLAELSTVVAPCEILGRNTKPYGLLCEAKIEKTTLNPENGTALVLQIAVAKRGKRTKRKTDSDEEEEEDDTQPKEEKPLTPEEVESVLLAFNQRTLLKRWKNGEADIDPAIIRSLRNNKVVLKSIALPCSTNYEPWIVDLLKYIQQNRRLSFDYNRQELRDIIQRNLKGIVPPSARTKTGGSHNAKNILRRWRINHLAFYYGFTGMDLTVYSGWTLKTASQATGQAGGSSTVDNYLDLQWQTYFPRLCVPIEDLVK